MGGDRDEYPGMPRWVKAAGIVVIVLILALLAVLAFGGGEHGPGRHVPSGASGDGGSVGGSSVPRGEQEGEAQPVQTPDTLRAPPRILAPLQVGQRG